MELYTYPLAYNPQKAKIVLVEKQLPHKDKVINLFNGDSLSPAYLKLNPQSTAPTLVDGDTVLTDSIEIVKYVDGKGETLGGGLVDKALADDWVSETSKWDGNLFVAASQPGTAKILGGLTKFKVKYAQARAKEHPELASLYDDKIKMMEAEPEPGAGEANFAQLNALLDRAETQLGKTKYLAGDAYSIADVVFTPVLARINQIKDNAKYIEPRPKVAEYYELVKARPSYAAACAPASNPVNALTSLVPAILKSKFAGLTGRY